MVADLNPVSPTLSARRNSVPILRLCSARAAGFMAVGSVHDVPHVWREVEGPSVVRRVNLEDATWQEVVGVVVGQDVLRGNLRRCIRAISDSERHAASMTRRCHSGKSPTEPASSTRSVRTRSWVSVRGRGLLWVGPGRPWRGWLGGAVSGGGGGARWTRRCSTMRVATQDTITPARRVLASASRPLPGFGIHESDGAPDEKEGRPKHESPGYQACMMAR